MADVASAVAEVLSHQSWFARRKDTLVTVCTAVLWLVGVVTPLVAGWPAWVGVVVGVVGSVAGACVNAFTRGAVTPSMAGRLETAVERLDARPASFSVYH